jgi:transcriptional regulator with XRE-family HTH domain
VSNISLAFSKDLVAKRLKEARLAAKLSQKKLGIAAGIDEFSASARMNQYETGKHIPDILTLNKIAKVLKLPIAYFYAEDENLAILIKMFGKLNKHGQLALISKANKIIVK